MAKEKKRKLLMETTRLRYQAILTGDTLELRREMKWASADEFMLILIACWKASPQATKDAAFLSVLKR